MRRKSFFCFLLRRLRDRAPTPSAIERFPQAHALCERLGDAEADRVGERLNALRDATSTGG